MNWNEIVSNAKKIKKSVEENQKVPTISGYSHAEILYIFSKSVQKIARGVDKVKATNCKDCTGTGIYKNLKKDEYTDVAKRAGNWILKESQAPNYVNFGSDKISVRLAIFGFAKIIVYYANHKAMPNTCWFANSVFYTKTVVTGTLCKQLSKLAGINITDYKTLYSAMYNIFSYDYYFEDHQTQEETISRRKGNCVDLNQILYHALLEIYSSDKVQIVRGTVKCTDGVYGHVWCRIKINGVWINIDASASARGKPLGTVICAEVINITSINPAWAVNDTGDA